MSLWQAIFLGVLQGLTEFFPVSSSAHLHLAKSFFHLTDIPLTFDLTCHVGTVLASICYLRKQIKEAVKDRFFCFLIFLSILPLIPMYFLFKKAFFSFSNFNMGYFLILTSFFLFSSSKKDPDFQNSSLNRKIKDVLFIGFMQAMALLPGISRSGSTIFAAKKRGWTMKQAIEFSYLLAIPTILGGSLLESWKIFSKGNSLSFDQVQISFIALVASFMSGLISVKMIFYLAEKRNLKPFAWYCLILGFMSLIFFKPGI